MAGAQAFPVLSCPVVVDNDITRHQRPGPGKTAASLVT